jgi:hypothetical protein
MRAPSRDAVHSLNLRAFMWMNEWLPHAAIEPPDQRLADDWRGLAFTCI